MAVGSGILWRFLQLNRWRQTQPSRYLNEPEEIESGQERSGELDVLFDGPLGIVSAVSGIGGGEDADAGVERGHETRFGDGDGLLLHHFVDRRSIVLHHLVKLVDAANT